MCDWFSRSIYIFPIRYGIFYTKFYDFHFNLRENFLDSVKIALYSRQFYNWIRAFFENIFHSIFRELQNGLRKKKRKKSS